MPFEFGAPINSGEQHHIDVDSGTRETHSQGRPSKPSNPKRWRCETQVVTFEHMCMHFWMHIFGVFPSRASSVIV